MGEHIPIEPGPKKQDMFSVETREAISGLVGAAFCTYVSLPMDLLKVRLQTSLASDFKNPADALFKTLRNEGVASLWKGLTPALASAALENTLLFSLNGAMRRAATKDNKKKLTFTQEMALGAVSGAASATVVSPTEVIKGRLQVTRSALARSGQPAPTGLIPTITSLWREQGIRGFYRGLPLMYARDIPFFMIYFANYQKYVSMVMEREGLSDKSELSVFHVMLGGGLAGCASWALTLPLDNLTVRAQTVGLGKNVGALRMFAQLVRTEGIRSMYSGFGPCMARAFVYNAALFLGVEGTDRLLSMPTFQVPSPAQVTFQIPQRIHQV
jgi:hypothetical protein